MPVIRLGTQGWAYPDWVATFYPPGAKQQDYLKKAKEMQDKSEETRKKKSAGA